MVRMKRTMTNFLLIDRSNQPGTALGSVVQVETVMLFGSRHTLGMSSKFSRRAFSFGAMSLGTLALTGCGKGGGGASWRQKLTISAYTNDGDVTGSSVTELKLTSKDKKVGIVGIVGEATVLDMGGGRMLFALLDKNHAYLVPRMFLGFEGANEQHLPLNLKMEPLAELGQSRSVPVELCPSMASFVTVKQPLSVKRVDPASLGSMFGTGFGIKSIELELTDEPVTTGAIASVLPDDLFIQWDAMRRLEKTSEKHVPFEKSYLSKLTPEMFNRKAG